eukprot:1582963-Amphidinium_carterae.1
MQNIVKFLVKKLELEAELHRIRSGEVENVAILAILSDKGECSGYNRQMFVRNESITVTAPDRIAEVI